MKWSDLPQEYKDLEKGFAEVCQYDSQSDVILNRFRARHTPQGYSFWLFCHMSKKISELPKIPKNDK